MSRENVAGTPDGSGLGYTGWRVMMHSGPSAIAAKNGGRCVACISSHVESMVGSFRCASSGEWPFPGKCFGQTESPARCMPLIRAAP